MPAVESANELELATYISRFLPNAEQSLGTGGSKNANTLLLSIESASSISKIDLQACFNLIESTSREDYVAASTGWHPRAKKKEMSLPDLRYLLIRETAEKQPLAFASFMMTYEDGHEVVYVYEVHIADHHRGRGIGRRLMDLVEEAGYRAGMKKAMLTVFVSNGGANAFYRHCGYAQDEYSPEPKRLRGGIVKEPDYRILSKMLEGQTSIRSTKIQAES